MLNKAVSYGHPFPPKKGLVTQGRTAAGIDDGSISPAELTPYSTKASGSLGVEVAARDCKKRAQTDILRTATASSGLPQPQDFAPQALQDAHQLQVIGPRIPKDLFFSKLSTVLSDISKKDDSKLPTCARGLHIHSSLMANHQAVMVKWIQNI